MHGAAQAAQFLRASHAGRLASSLYEVDGIVLAPLGSCPYLVVGVQRMAIPLQSCTAYFGQAKQLMLIRKTSDWTSRILAILMLCSGCAMRSDWSNPGTIVRQQSRAMRHDPYSDNEIAPSVVGGRPRDYQAPIPQAVRNQPYPQIPAASPTVPLY